MPRCLHVPYSVLDREQGTFLRAGPFPASPLRAGPTPTLLGTGHQSGARPSLCLTADFSTVDPIRRCLPNILLQDLLHLSYKHGLQRVALILTPARETCKIGRENFSAEPSVR